MTFHRILSIAVFLLCSSVLVVPSATAQEFDQPSSSSSSSSSGGDSGETLTTGNSAISLDFNLGGNPVARGTAGFWHLFTDSLSIGLNLGLRIENGNDRLTGDYAGPEVNTPGVTGVTSSDWGFAIAPALKYFFQNGRPVVPFLFGKINLAFADNRDEYFGLVVGGGAEWFPTAYFSVGGYVGLHIGADGGDFGLGLITSSLAANFYF